MATYELVSGGSVECWQSFRYDSFEDFEQALSDYLDRSRDGSLLEIGFHPQGAPAFTIPEAFEALVALAERRLPPAARVRCFFATERAAAHCARLLPETDRAREEVLIGPIRAQIVVGDIIRVRADAIVNASNTSLVLGAGVSGAIKRAVANPSGLQAAMRALAPISAGGVVLTDSFGLKTSARIIHAATATGEAETVRSAMRGILSLCAAKAIAKVALPALGCGTGALRIETFAKIAREEIEQHAASKPAAPKDLLFVLFDAASHAAFTAAFTER